MKAGAAVLLFLALTVPALLAQGPTLPFPFVPQISGAPAAYVQDKECIDNFAGSPATCIFNSTPGSGDGIAIIIGWSTATSTITSVVDGNTASYANTPWASGATNCQALGYDSRLYTLANSAGTLGAKTIVVTWSAAPGYALIAMVDASGVASSSMVDKADCSANTGGTSSPTSPSVTTTGADFLWSAVIDGGGTGHTWTAGATPAFTLRFTSPGANGSGYAQESFVQSSGGAVTGNYTNTGTAYPLTSIVALKP